MHPGEHITKEDIGQPLDPEHFLHAGAGDTNPEAISNQNQRFAAAVERRSRKLPRPPTQSGMNTPVKHSGVGGAMTPGPTPIHMPATPITPLPTTPSRKPRKGLLRTPLGKRSVKDEGREAFKMTAAYAISGNLDLLDAMLQTGTVQITMCVWKHRASLSPCTGEMTISTHY